MVQLNPGLYEQLLTRELQQNLDCLADPRLYSLDPVDAEESHAVIAQFLEHLLVSSLSTYRGVDAATNQKRLVDRIISTLTDELGQDWSEQLSLVTPLRRLIAIHSKPVDSPTERPDTPLNRSALFTGTRELSLGSQIRKELVSADRVDILCSFIKWSGLRVVMDALRELSERDPIGLPRIRVITTSYMGATDPRAIEELSKLSNTEIRVSYDTQRTRLHAKAYIFHRQTGFGSAYVGSANLSHAALSEGLEWTTKISHYELPYLWNKITGTFDTYWGDDEFQIFDGNAPERLRSAIQSEQGTSGHESRVSFDLRPYPFQDEILDILSAERQNQRKFRHLVVAATGTGKTMIAAFDYARVCRELGYRLPLLFVAHREEILIQAIGSFRAVLRDHNFGDLAVGGHEHSQDQHLFCSIQSYNAREMTNYPVDKFGYVVVDEFHHAAAPSYQRLLNHVQPKVLLGLTATPERSDQLDILSWFGGSTSAEIRLPDAINRRLLCPFQYFGIADSVDLDGLSWQRGGYRVDDLERVYTGNDIRARLVLDKIHEILLNPRRSRCIGFCVSVAHAEFMSRFFNENELPSVALTGNSSDEVRRTAQERLRTYDINCIFVVDLYNEGVDSPEIDSLLFLRPTESLTVFLQQFGRGLRLHPDKDCLTVLDFIGAQRREFRFAERFRALSTKPEGRLDREIENGCPHLPNGCVVRLERIAQQRVLNNIRASVQILRPRMVRSLQSLANYLGRSPTIDETLEYLDTSLDELLKRGLWSHLLGDAGIINAERSADDDRLSKGLRRLCHVDCTYQIRELLKLLDVWNPALEDDERSLMEMLHTVLWGDVSLNWSLNDSDNRLRQNSVVMSDLRAVLEHQLRRAPAQNQGRIPKLSGPLSIHSHYTRDEILIGLGHWSLNRRPDHREGVLHIATSKVDAFFVTLQKTEDDYSPTTMYEDFLISHDRFHWQSQSNTSVDSPTGQRYINHKKLGYTPLLFVREKKNLPSGIAAPYAYLGPCEYQSHEGSRPISIVWRLKCLVPARLFRVMARQSVG